MSCRPSHEDGPVAALTFGGGGVARWDPPFGGVPPGPTTSKSDVQYVPGLSASDEDMGSAVLCWFLLPSLCPTGECRQCLCIFWGALFAGDTQLGVDLVDLV